ncbi:transposase [Streptomyces sp. NPDC005500]|uniref:transposase n=1 Tax=Streptomyces sp. NPDC005500 TaxID=3155007 RepID=UPI0033B724B7
MRECAGAAAAPGHARRTRTSREEDADHRALHLPARRCDGRLRRRARTGDPAHFPPTPGWSPDGQRIKNEIECGRGPERTWVYDGLSTADEQEIMMTASSRNSAFYQQFLNKLEDADPVGDIYLVTDNLSSHKSGSLRAPGWRTTLASGMCSSRSAPAG